MLELIGICDVIAHLAAAVGVELIIDEPLKSIHTNIVGTEIVLELANKFRKKTFLGLQLGDLWKKFASPSEGNRHPDLWFNPPGPLELCCDQSHG